MSDTAPDLVDGQPVIATIPMEVQPEDFPHDIDQDPPTVAVLPGYQDPTTPWPGIAWPEADPEAMKRLQDRVNASLERQASQPLADTLATLEAQGAVIRPMAGARNTPGLTIPLDTFLERLTRDLADNEAALRDQRDDQGWVDANLERATEGHRELLGRYLVNAALALLEG